MLLAVTTMIGLPSCHNDEEDQEYKLLWDTYPIILSIKVVNSAGQNLLDRNVTGNILDEKMTLTIDGQTIDVAMTKPDHAIAKSRHMAPIWYGAYVTVHKNSYCIDISEFEGAVSYRQSMELNLGDKKYELSFTNTVTQKKREIFLDRLYYLDGQLIQSGYNSTGNYTITLD